MTTHPKREYTPEEIKKLRQHHLSQVAVAADDGYPRAMQRHQQWADMLESLASQLAAQTSYVHKCGIHSDYQPACQDCMKGIPEKTLDAQKLEGERKPGVYSELWVSIMNARDAYERTEGNYRDPKSRTILRKQCRMISEFLRSCDPLLAIQPPSPNQDREVSP